MSDDQKYYYLKLKNDFFDSNEMIVLESLPDGYLYSNILLKLYLRSLKDSGKLMLNDRIPFNSTMLAQVTRHTVGVVEKALKVFEDLCLIEILDSGAIYLSDIQNFIGKSSTEADRKREYRRKIEMAKSSQRLIPCQESDICPDKCPSTPDICPDKYPPEIEIELETELELETETEREKDQDECSNEHLSTAVTAADGTKPKTPPCPHQKIIDAYHHALPELPQIRVWDKASRQSLQSRWREDRERQCLEWWRQLFDYIHDCDFLMGKKVDFRADLHWIVRPSNFAKIINGRYENRNGNDTHSRLQEIGERWLRLQKMSTTQDLSART